MKNNGFHQRTPKKHTVFHFFVKKKKKGIFFFTGRDTEEYRIKYNTLLLGIAMFLMFSFSTLRVLQREFRVKIL